MSSGKTILLNEYSWIDLDFFRTVLNDEGPVKTICDYKLEPFLVDGENFSSLVLRASVDYALGNGSNSRIHTVYLIIKANLAGLTRSRNVFAKEIHIYENIVPHLKNILRQMDNKSQLVPKYGLTKIMRTFCFIFFFVFVLTDTSKAMLTISKNLIWYWKT